MEWCWNVYGMVLECLWNGIGKVLETYLFIFNNNQRMLEKFFNFCKRVG